MMDNSIRSTCKPDIYFFFEDRLQQFSLIIGFSDAQYRDRVFCEYTIQLVVTETLSKI